MARIKLVFIKTKQKKKRKQSHNIHNPGQPEGSGSYDSMIHSYEGDRRTRHVSGHHMVTGLELLLDGDPEKGGLVSSGVPRGAEHWRTKHERNDQSATILQLTVITVPTLQ